MMGLKHWRMELSLYTSRVVVDTCALFARATQMFCPANFFFFSGDEQIKTPASGLIGKYYTGCRYSNKKLPPPRQSLARIEESLLVAARSLTQSLREEGCRAEAAASSVY